MTDHFNTPEAEPVKLYRALFTPDHVQRWRSGQFTSWHHVTPTHWLTLWRSGVPPVPEDYPLEERRGGEIRNVYTKAAREAFLRYAPLYRPSDRWNSEHEREASELAGVCAYQDAAKAYEYEERTTGESMYVAFRGRVLCPVWPEKADGAVCAAVVEPGCVLTADQFHRTYLTDTNL